MKIAQFVTASYSYPLPAGVVFAPLETTNLLIDGLLARGHDVSWYIPKGAETRAKVRDFGIVPSQLDKRWKKMTATQKTSIHLFSEALFLSRLADEAKEYDIIHIHSFLLALAFARLIKDRPVVFTLHNPLTDAHVQANALAHKDLKNVFFISISNNQRKPLPDLNYLATIYHGLEMEKIAWSAKPGRRWVWVGRIVPEKGPDIAIKLAHRLNLELDIIGPIPKDPIKSTFFVKKIKPYIDGKQIRYLGAKSYQNVLKAFAAAKGFLFPLRWEEPFGLTYIESLACGTPVVTFNRGAASEIIESGHTGFVVETEGEMEKAILRIEEIDRSKCRRAVEERFNAKRVVEEHIQAYKEAIRRFKTQRG